ncbi:MAG TPA: FtsX-like permease family protein [Candidatus Polarisedimenticolaceae bacterium]|nr:FtsX-like permease family protein [Candidatus Polarisedimenticolaceae bacterium]
MKLLRLVLSGLLRRKRTRTVFTVLSVLIAFVLFGYLAAIRTAFTLGIEVAGVDRLLTTHKTSIIMFLPESYQERIARIPGVLAVTHATWFGGIYQNPNQNFQGVFQGGIDPRSYLQMYPEFKLPPQQLEAWLADREGAIVGRTTAERYGWKVGDRVPIQATLWRKKDGGSTWEFNIDGIYDADHKGVDTTQFLFRYDYFDEGRAFGQGTIGWYILRVAEPARSEEIARAIDAEFANSPYETKTQTEKALVRGFANQIGDIGTIITAILGAVFFTMLLVAGNTMAQSVRERTAELGLLKTLGFTDGQVVTMVLVESCLLAGLGGFLGLAIGWLLVARGDPTGSFLPAFYIPGKDLVVGALFVLVFGVLTGLLPARQAMRLEITSALRRA